MTRAVFVAALLLAVQVNSLPVTSPTAKDDPKIWWDYTACWRHECGFLQCSSIVVDAALEYLKGYCISFPIISSLAL
uniref:Uncharacterized protein n=1 Tax=Sphaerodactylus townsendi TaxID=933632 RepID=A0ACB8G5Z6_9SAUR